MSHVIDLPQPDAPPTPYFDVAYARKLRPLQDVERYPDADIEDARQEAEEKLEQACGVAFVPRTAHERLDGPGTGDLLVPHPRLLGVTGLEIDGEPASTDDLVVYHDGRVHRPGGWGHGRQSILITYVHGFEELPLEVKRAARLLAKTLLVGSGIDERAAEVRTDAGVLRLAGGTFGIPAVDAIVDRYRQPTVA
ncbi:MAG TPA: hypothetical protein VFR97_10280 [Capillimicrobium sp.]|nr:hypothetical protein [Capillimicrobium sp.]